MDRANSSDAQIYDRGYRHYDGPREGRTHAIRALISYSIKRGLGVKKRWTAKIIPILVYGFAFFPVVIIVGIRSFIGDAAQGFNYQTLYDLLATVLLVFAAATAPEMLCDDRRQRVLPLYFSRAISRGDYLLAKLGGLGILMATVSLLPAFILFLGVTFLADSPTSYFVHHTGDILRIVADGCLLSLFFASIGLVIASFTDRKSVAAAVYIGSIVLISGLVAALFDAVDASWHRYLLLASPMAIPQSLTAWIFGSKLSGDSAAAQANVAGQWYLVSVAAVVVVCSFIVYRQYLRDE
ncbi:MAG: ABC transporter permease subunit [Nitrolancea sp.]